MPRRFMAGVAGADAGWPSLTTWQAAGLSLAVLTTAFLSGLGGLAGAVALVGVIWSLGRLRSRAPEARSTCDLVGATLGERAAAMVAVLQLFAYLFLAAALASTTGMYVLSAWLGDPDRVIDGRLWPMCSAIAVVAAGAAGYLLSTRVVAIITAVLAGAAALTVCYLALAVIAKVYAGAEPIHVGQQRSGLGGIATVLLLALAVVGVEVVTTINRQVGSVARPMALALAAAMVCMVLVFIADQAGTAGVFSYSADNFGFAVADLLGSAGKHWLLAATISGAVSALLAVMWALMRVSGRITRRHAAGNHTPGDVVALVLILIVALAAIALGRNWPEAPLSTSAAPILLIVVYLFVAVASARLPRFENVTWAIKVGMSAILAAVVVVVLLADDFGASALWRVAVAGLVVAAAAVIATRWPQLVGVDMASESKNPDTS